MKTIGNRQLSVAGRVFRTGKLRHEWCDFLDDPQSAVEEAKTAAACDLFTFVQEIGAPPLRWPDRIETAALAVLRVPSFKQWWDGIGFKTRNKIRKAEKCGVEIRIDVLDDAFARGVEAMYAESPVRQGRKFYHYGKSAAAIKEELSSFADRTILVGAYHQSELIGFMKLYRGVGVLRTVHILAKLSHREKCAMDALIAKGAQLCDEAGVRYLQYGSWTDGGIGTFREKHGFERLEVPRYYSALTGRGRLMLALNLHRPFRDRLPKGCVDAIIGLRAKWNSVRFGSQREAVNS